MRSKLTDVEVFDDWYAAGPEADDFWKSYEQGRGRSYEESLRGYAARHVFDFDKHHIDTSTHALLVLPAGKSGHMELMYAAYGAKINAAILLDPEDVRWDVMYQFIPTILRREDDVEQWIKTKLLTYGDIAAGRGQREAGISDGRWPARLFSERIGGSR